MHPLKLLLPMMILGCNAVIGDIWTQDEASSRRLLDTTKPQVSPADKASKPHIPPGYAPVTKSGTSLSESSLLVIFFVTGIICAGLVTIFWRCRRRTYRGFEKLDTNPLVESDEELPSVELAKPSRPPKGATMLDIREEEQKLVKLVERADREGPEVTAAKEAENGDANAETEPLFRAEANQNLSRAEAINSKEDGPPAGSKSTPFDVGDVSSSD